MRKTVAALICAVALFAMLTSCTKRYVCPSCHQETSLLFKCPVCGTEVCPECYDAWRENAIAQLEAEGYTVIE